MRWVQKGSDGVSRLGVCLETCLETRFFLVTLHRSFFMKFCKMEFLKKTVLKMVVQNLTVQRGQWLRMLFAR